MDCDIGFIQPSFGLLTRLREHQCWLASLGQAGKRFVAEEKERFSGLDLRGVNLRQAILAGAIFEACDCRWAELDDADLRMSTWFDSDLRSATVADVLLRGAAFVDSQVDRMQFKNVDLQDVTWTSDEMFEAEETRLASATPSVDIK